MQVFNIISDDNNRDFMDLHPVQIINQSLRVGVCDTADKSKCFFPSLHGYYEEFSTNTVNRSSFV